MIILFVDLNCIKSKFDFYILAVVCKRSFFLRIKICNAHNSLYVIILGYVFKFQSNRVNFVSS